jgi:TonB-dependent SusC/RagA subfamily outer membrane receptor
VRLLALHSYTVWAVSAALLGASGACHRPARYDGVAEQGRVADSSRNAAERNRSAATQAVDFDEGERSRFTRVEHMIQAHFAGVQVTPAGNGFSIRIRGTGSFGSSNEPLVLIDGASRSTADLRGVNPRDVERIEIMKDAAASFYGVRGANGVIVIKTTRAR